MKMHDINNANGVMRPWIPVEIKDKENKIDVNVWGRTYTCGEQSFLESILSQGEEILAAPIRMVGVENGKEIVWESMKHCVMDQTNEENAGIGSYTQSERFVLNTNMKIEYDGCIELCCSIMPRGRSVNQCFGLGEYAAPQYVLSQLWMEIPLREEVSEFYQFFPNSEMIINGRVHSEDKLHQSGKLPEQLILPFKEQVFIGNDCVGLAIFFESDENMQPQSTQKVIEIMKTGEGTILRIHLLDSEPYKWLDKGYENGMDLFPLSFRMGIMATPVKEFPQNPYEERAIHIDCFKKIPQDYEEFLAMPFEETEEIVFDRFKRLGVNTLYIHEKWNEIQNSPFLTKMTAERLKYIVAEAHKREIKVIPYFGYEISTLSPYWSEYGEEVINRESESEYAWHWYRYPWQRDPIVCYNSRWQEIFAKGIERLMDQFDFDGIYLDGTNRPMGCTNEKHGCGWRDREGNLHTTYPVWAVRSLMKKLYKIVDSRGGVINCHGSAAFNAAALSFCHSQWEGEMIQQELMHGEVKELPEAHFRSVFCGRNIGVPVYMLCYSNPPTWTFSQALSMTLPMGLLPKPVDSGEPLEIMSHIWKMLDKFDFADAVWHPYFNNTLMTTDTEAVRVSCYKAGEKCLIFCANTKDCPVEAEVVWNSRLRVKDWVGSAQLEMMADKFLFEAKTFDYAVILAEECEARKIAEV